MLGFLRLGFIDVVLSRALLRGFITAVAVIIMMWVNDHCFFLRVCSYPTANNLFLC